MQKSGWTFSSKLERDKLPCWNRVEAYEEQKKSSVSVCVRQVRTLVVVAVGGVRVLAQRKIKPDEVN